MSVILGSYSALDIGHASLTISRLHYVSGPHAAGLINRQMFTISPHFCHLRQYLSPPAHISSDQIPYSDSLWQM